VRGVRHLFYARTGEGWRIDAYIMMMAAAAKAGWSEGFERLQGSLLGRGMANGCALGTPAREPARKEFLLAATAIDQAAVITEAIERQKPVVSNP